MLFPATFTLLFILTNVIGPTLQDLNAANENLQSRMKKVKHRMMNEQLEKDMSSEDRKREAEVKQQQLEAIFKLMEKNPDQFGISSMSEMEEQVKLYNM